MINDNLIEITLNNDNDFLKIKETLSRIGIAAPKQKKLFQSCHILHKRGKYYIVHFKQMFELDGKKSNLTEDDLARRNTIISLLEEWELLKVVSPEKIDEPQASLSNIKILTYSEKKDWELVQKYSIGKKKRFESQ